MRVAHCNLYYRCQVRAICRFVVISDPLCYTFGMVGQRKNNRKMFIFLCGAALGAVAFFVLFPVSCLDPTDLSYVRGGYVERDIIQHYAGWKFYRSEPLSFPLGIASNMNYPEGASVVYSDSIPLFAVLFRFLEPLLPEQFQYFGWFVFLSYLLQGGCAALLLSLFLSTLPAVLAAAVPFVFSPILAERAFRHVSLTAHWLILLAFYAYFSHKRNGRTICWIWFFLAVITPLIHTYFLPMIYAVFFAETLDCGERKEKILSAVRLILCLALSVFSLFCVGAFSTGSSGSSYGYGYFAMNINSVFNPVSASGICWSLFLPALPQGYGTYEGFNYMGLGVLIAFFSVGIFLLLRFRKEKPLRYAAAHPGLLFVCVSLTAFAVSTTVIANNSAFIRIQLPQKLYELCSTFRSSGRMFWPVYYLVFLFTVVFLSHRFSAKHLGTVVLLVLSAVQLLDLSPAVLTKRNSFSTSPQFEILTDSPFFSENKDTYDHISSPGTSAFRGLYAALWASENGMTTDFPFLARYDADRHAEEAAKTREKLLRGEADPDTLYLFSLEDESAFHDIAFYINGNGVVCGQAAKDFFFIAPDNGNLSIPENSADFILYADIPFIIADYSDDIWDHGVLAAQPGTITFLNNAFTHSYLDGAKELYCEGRTFRILKVYEDPGYIMVDVEIPDGHELTGKILSTDRRP